LAEHVGGHFLQQKNLPAGGVGDLFRVKKNSRAPGNILCKPKRASTSNGIRSGRRKQPHRSDRCG
jgi:hypothetical protein